MEQMQNVVLNMLQAMTSTKVESHQTTKKENAEESEFRKLMEEETAGAEQKQPVSERSEQKPVEKEYPESDEELDQTSLQELAAMQMFYMGTVQTVVTPEEQVNPEIAVEGLNLEETASVVQASGQEQIPSEVLNGQEGEQLDVQSDGEIQSPVQVEQEVSPVDAQAETVEAKTEVQTEVDTEQGAEEQNDLQMTEGETQVFEHVEAAPIKVSETARTTETSETAQTETVESQIVEKVTQAVSNGETKVELQLNPEHLGKVTIEMTQKADGTLHIAVHAENSQTRSLLERDAAGLQNLLGRTAQQEVRVEVYQPQESERDNFYQQQQQHQQQEQQEKQEQQRRRNEPVDFLNQLRLGLVAQDE